MLAVFEKAIGKPPEELGLPSLGSKNLNTRKDVAEFFQSRRPEATLYKLPDGNVMALSHQDESPFHPR